MKHQLTSRDERGPARDGGVLWQGDDPALAAPQPGEERAKVWTNGEETYVAHSLDELILFMREELGCTPDESEPEDWEEQTGQITFVFDKADLPDELHEAAALMEYDEHGDRVEVTMSAEDWVSWLGAAPALLGSSYL
ncbi:hypothetical protein [Polyangium fumosum]|uniref:Uncharacterized protein n=1 Tax=Polyangium fumosum TaxID=889272 RepID=A0A4U1J087_9BACT|nr:hypothetical protein [Polyangium fumosum]TKD00419.1 hypothetical protein E8A74_34560 [Polyangium fumosum]